MKIQNNSGWRPVGKALLLRAIELQEKQKGGRIVIPDEVAMSSASCDTRGLVVAVGDDAWTDTHPRCKTGDEVLFTQYSGGSIIGTDGYIYRMVNASAVYAVREKSVEVQDVAA